MGLYACQTKVGRGKTLEKMGQLLTRFGATELGQITTETQLYIGFNIKGKKVRFNLRLPSVEDTEIKFTPTTCKERSMYEKRKLLDRAINQRWRAMFISIKAKLIAIDDKISTFDEEFAQYFVTSSGQTVGELMTKKTIDEIIKVGSLEQLLPGPHKKRTLMKLLPKKIGERYEQALRHSDN